MGDVLIFAEHQGGHFPKTTLTAVHAGLDLAKKRVEEGGWTHQVTSRELPVSAQAIGRGKPESGMKASNSISGKRMTTGMPSSVALRTALWQTRGVEKKLQSWDVSSSCAAR